MDQDLAVLQRAKLDAWEREPLGLLGSKRNIRGIETWQRPSWTKEEESHLPIAPLITFPKLPQRTYGPLAAHQCVTAHWLKTAALTGHWTILWLLSQDIGQPQSSPFLKGKPHLEVKI